jgi:hypothetical protein
MQRGAPGLNTRLDLPPESPFPCTVGTFAFDMVNGVLSWSDALFGIYGYEVDEVTPTKDLLLDACHPDDRAQAAAVMSATLASGIGCVNALRIITPSNDVRHIVVVGSGIKDSNGVTVEMSGYVVDVSRTTNTVVAESVQDAVETVVASRGVIEQAKGALMLAFCVDADTAFGVLSWQSQMHNVKLRSLAEQVMLDLHGSDPLDGDLRANVSHLILTAHERVPGVCTQRQAPPPEGGGAWHDVCCG